MRSERAVSTALGYTLSLAIASLLVTGLLIAGSDFVDDRREEVLQDELSVVGEQVASDVARVDRLAVAGTGTTKITLNQTYPERVTGSTYQISFETSPDRIVLASTDPSIRVTVDINTVTPLASGASTDGGAVQTAYDSSTNELVIQDV